MKMTADHVKTFKEQGVVIINDYFPEETRAAIAEGLRGCLPPWDAIKDDPPVARSRMQPFPYPTLALNRMFVDPGLLWFARQVLETERIQYRNGMSIVRYPGEMVGTKQGWHIDNGNNSLLPETDDWRYGQVVVWYWPEEIEPGQAPLQVIPKPHNNDLAHAITLAVPANTLVIFHNFVWHSGSDFTVEHGERYSHAGMFGREDFYWEGLQHYTHQQRNPQFKELVASCTAAEREVFRFPPAGHPYYTPKTLAMLEATYPGWNARGEY